MCPLTCWNVNTSRFKSHQPTSTTERVYHSFQVCNWTSLLAFPAASGGAVFLGTSPLTSEPWGLSWDCRVSFGHSKLYATGGTPTTWISSMTYAVWDLYRPAKKKTKQKKTLCSRSPVPLRTFSHRSSDKLLAWLWSLAIPPPPFLVVLVVFWEMQIIKNK